jgi:hypothetical protein
MPANRRGDLIRGFKGLIDVSISGRRNVIKKGKLRRFENMKTLH